MGRTADLDAALDEFYLSAVDPAAWARLPFTLVDLFGAGCGALWTLDATTGAPGPDIMTTMPAEHIAEYVAHYHRLNPWRGPAMRHPIGQPFMGASLISDAELARTAYHGEFGRKAGTFHMLSVAMHLDRAADGMLIGITTHRPESASRFDPDQLRLMGRLMPHVRRVVRLRGAVRPAGELPGAVEASMDAMQDAAILTDRRGRVVHANGAAQAADIAGTVRLRTADGLGAGSPDRTTALRRCIADAAAGGAGGTVQVASGAFAVVSPVPDSLGERIGCGRGHVLVMLRVVPQVSDRFIGRARALFGLTRAEAEAACAVAAGQSPEQVAASRQVRLSTVRTLLQRAMARTGTEDLRKLAVLLCTVGG